MQVRVFSEGMKLLAVYFGPIGGDKLEESDADKLTALYWRGLQDLADGAFEMAITEAIKRCKFWPKAAELREWSAAWRPPVIRHEFTEEPLMIGEFTDDDLRNAPKDFNGILAGLVDAVKVPKAAVVQFEKRRQQLHDQAEVLLEVAA